MKIYSKIVESKLRRAEVTKELLNEVNSDPELLRHVVISFGEM